MAEQGWPLVNLATSPITGQKGNREFLIHCVAKDRGTEIDEERIHQEVMQ